jgi:hypothetical protein
MCYRLQVGKIDAGIWSSQSDRLGRNTGNARLKKDEWRNSICQQASRAGEKKKNSSKESGI